MLAVRTSRQYSVPMTDPNLLSRIANALDRLAPPPSAAPAAHALAYRWQDGTLHALESFRPVSLALLTGIDSQRDAVVENSRRLATGAAAHDILLWGARGSGKSALVKASVASLQEEGYDLALVEVAANGAETLSELFTLLGKSARKYILFIDDLAFAGADGAARALRSTLEGGAAARPSNVRLYVTSNRRHIVAREMAEQESAINPRDVADDRLALADRFGLSLGFHVCDQGQYLAMVGAYARHLELEFDEQDALLWASQRGARSGRVAWHYAVELAGRAGKAL
jgi:uncharacterized protein